MIKVTCTSSITMARVSKHQVAKTWVYDACNEQIPTFANHMISNFTELSPAITTAQHVCGIFISYRVYQIGIYISWIRTYGTPPRWLIRPSPCWHCWIYKFNHKSQIILAKFWQIKLEVFASLATTSKSWQVGTAHVDMDRHRQTGTGTTSYHYGTVPLPHAITPSG